MYICKIYVNATTIYKRFTTTVTHLMYLSRLIVYKIQMVHSSYSSSLDLLQKWKHFKISIYTENYLYLYCKN